MKHLTEPDKLFFFKRGTTVPVAVFADEECTIQHTNPVFADAEYRFPKIFFDKNPTDYEWVTVTALNSKDWHLFSIDFQWCSGSPTGIRYR